ncbi:GNAT family N-acetyltransferase [Pseudomonas zeshuii]|uniref:Predicted N-acyltransferase, GNAT family n=2 Tax=Pseudomonas TaxID=286 RepID=A0A9X8QIS3_9PSED|nr:GNAT family N-acetyltransferase [Pseudomonas zeshuii]QEU28563.1 GNAT family N-acetyltransferase [Pseudomonas luteola]SEQ18572.1 Predicted N-acyltransferase, GNAT family [Pseudomonas lutea]
MSDLSIRVADWKRDNEALRHIRETVFIQEQAVPPEMEWDSEDEHAIHFLAQEGLYPVGTARLLEDGRIGRVAVLRDWRGLNVGSTIMHAVISEAERRGLHRQVLSAQIQAIPFYQRLGFTVTGDEYLEAGIAHVDMTRHSTLEQTEAVAADEKREMRFETPDAAALHIVELLSQARRSICIYSPDFEPQLYNRSDVEHAITRFLLAHPRNRLRVLLKDSGQAVRQSHRLINLARRLTSNFLIRRRSPDYPADDTAYVLIDDQGLVIRNNPQLYTGTAYYNARATVRLQQSRFDSIWQTSQSDPNVRSMVL